MSRYYLFILSIILLLIGGCADKSNIKNRIETDQNIKTQSSLYELNLLIHALYYKEHGDFIKAYALFDRLYKDTRKLPYKIESLKLLISLGGFKSAKVETLSLLKLYPNNVLLYRILTLTQLKLNSIDEALKSAKKALEIEPDNIENIDLVASIYIVMKKYQKALDLYNQHYNKHHDEQSLIKIASITYHKLKDVEKTVQMLRSHMQFIGCSESVCLFLAEIYRQRSDLNNLAKVYAKLYKTTNKSEYAQKAAEIFAYEKKYDKAIELLESSKTDNRLLLAILKQTRQFKKAAKLAKEIYEDSLDPVWLAEYGVLLFEAAEDKRDKKLLSSVVDKLSKAFKLGLDDPLYFNYLGYLLIDNDIDIKQGIKLVKKALKGEPDSAFYIDSLAWGYYKEGRCDEAYKLMKKVVEKLGSDDEEIRLHLKKIEECMRQNALKKR